MPNMPHPRHGQHQACTPRKSCNRGSENSVARREIGDGRCASCRGLRAHEVSVSAGASAGKDMNGRGGTHVASKDWGGCGVKRPSTLNNGELHVVTHICSCLNSTTRESPALQCSRGMGRSDNQSSTASHKP